MSTTRWFRSAQRRDPVDRGVPVEVWRYSARLGLYFFEGEGLTFDQLAERSDYVAGHDDAPRVRIELGPPLDSGASDVE